MRNNTRHLALFIAGSAICAGAIAGAAIGLAAAASASPGSQSQTPQTSGIVRGPLIVATPVTTASPWVPPTHRVVVIPVDGGGE